MLGAYTLYEKRSLSIKFIYYFIVVMLKEAEKQGMISTIWGPSAWLFLHTVAHNYDPTKKGMKKGYYAFFLNLKHVLPCGACRYNFAKVIKCKALKFDNKVLASRKTLSFWLFKIHNKVQRDIYKRSGLERDKPKYSDSKKDFNKVYKMYEGFRAKCSSDPKVSYGCTVPDDGRKKRSKIYISKMKDFKAHTSLIIGNCA